MLCEIAKIDSKRFDELLKGDDVVFIHEVSPLPLSKEYLKLIEDALNVVSLYHERQRGVSMPRTQFLEKNGKVKED